MNKSIDEVEFTIFDTETTGLQPNSGDRVVEIAAMRFKGEDKIATFQALVNPNRPVSEAAFRVNKISAEMLRDSPVIEAVLPEFLNFIRDSCLCSYNAGFDLEFLNNELRLCGKGPLEDLVVVDILRMARRLVPGLERYALWFVAQRLGVKTEQQHRALSDVQLTWEVFRYLKKILGAKGLLDYAQFKSLFSINQGSRAEQNAQKLTQIQEAIDLRARVRIKYLSSSGLEVTEREVEPREIKREGGSCYLVGYCHLRKDERTFRIDGILHLEFV